MSGNICKAVREAFRFRVNDSGYTIDDSRDLSAGQYPIRIELVVANASDDAESIGG